MADSRILQSVTVNGVRTSGVTGQARNAEVTLSLAESKFGLIVHITGGAVTGWEYLGVKGGFGTLPETGWTACAGTKGEWDSLFIPGPELLGALHELGVPPEQ